ncbi:hypothetical protein AMTRI_Chr12g235680 [Amborella trichopoda]
MKTIESWNMMNYHQSRRGRLRGRWVQWYYDFYNYLKDGFIPDYATRGQRRARRELARRFVILEMSFTKGPSRGTRPSLQHRKKVFLVVEQTHSSGCGGHVNSQMLATKIMRQGPLLKVRVSRDARNVHSFDGI